MRQVKYNKQKLVKFNELLSKVLTGACVFWALLWVFASVKFISTGDYIGLAPAFLFGSPAIVWMYYRYTVHKKKSTKAIAE
ncbi:MAG: hypothetical protein H6Q58_260 [Firmicutes bacterium]|nr:hypothetical protein [Bacillota bacterium]